MTTEEYIKLVKDSGVYDELDEELKKQVLNASGDGRNSYVAIIIETVDSMKKAKQEFMEKNKKIMSDCTFEIKKISRSKVKSDENRSKKKDDEKSAELLGQLNKI